MVRDQRGAGLQVAVYDRGYTLQGYASDYVSATVSWASMDVGAGSIVLPEAHPMVGQLLQAAVQVVPVVVTCPWGARWTGRVDAASVDDGTGSTPAIPGAGLATVTLVDEWPWMKRMLASPNGANPSLTSMPENDARTGPVETVVKGYIRDAATRLGNVPVYVVPAPAVDRSPTVTLSARWTPLDQLVSGVLRLHNRSLTVSLWLPGDPQPAGVAAGSLGLSAPTVVVDIATARDNPAIVFTDDTLLTRKVGVSSPPAKTAVVGGAGSGTTQTFETVISAVIGNLGQWAFPETYISAAASTSTGQSDQDAQAEIAATEGGLSVAATGQDGVPWTYGVDYAVGDLVGVRALGVDVRQRVTRVDVTDDRAGGLRITPTIGDDAATLTPTQKLHRAVQRLSNRVQQLQTGA